MGKAGFLSTDAVKDVRLENLFLDGVSVRFSGFGKSNHTIKNCVFFSSTPIKPQEGFWPAVFGDSTNTFIDWCVYSYSPLSASPSCALPPRPFMV